MQPELSHFLIASLTGMIVVYNIGDLAERCRWLRPPQAILMVVGGWVISFLVGSLFLR